MSKMSAFTCHFIYVIDYAGLKKGRCVLLLSLTADLLDITNCIVLLQCAALAASLTYQRSASQANFQTLHQ